MTLRWRIFDSADRPIAHVSDPELCGPILPAGGAVRYGRHIVWRDDFTTPFDPAAMVQKAIAAQEARKAPHRVTLWRRRKRQEA